MDVAATAQRLIAVDSVTEASNQEISQLLRQWLVELGFDVELFPYVDAHGTPKFSLAAKRAQLANPQACATEPTANPGIGFFCHSDVVSVEGWDCSQGGPLSGTIAHGRLWGRGACDMKGPTAAALAAISRVAVERQSAPIYFFVTGDEECGMTGARLLTQQAQYYREMVAHGAVGLICEPTSLQVVNAHKGGCHLDVTSTGVAAHSSTAEGLNANWRMIPFLSFLEKLNARCQTDSRLINHAFAPPTLTMNVVIENRPQASNITVGKSICRVFFRPMPDTDWQVILADIEQTARQMQLEVVALPPLPPLHTPAESPLVQTALQLLGQIQPQAVSYATDGCCFQDLQELIVIGPGNIAQAHRSDEWIELEQLRRGVDVYQQLLQHYAG